MICFPERSIFFASVGSGIGVFSRTVSYCLIRVMFGLPNNVARFFISVENTSYSNPIVCVCDILMSATSSPGLSSFQSKMYSGRSESSYLLTPPSWYILILPIRLLFLVRANDTNASASRLVGFSEPTFF